MPNWVTNEVYFECKNVNMIARLRAQVKSGNNKFSFGKIIPMPESLNIESGSFTNDCYKLYEKFARKYKRESTIKKHFCETAKTTGAIFLSEILNNDELEKAYERGKVAYENKQKYRCTDWYDWAYDNWGTKWDAFDAQWHDDEHVSFETAWSTPEPVIKKLSEMFPMIEVSCYYYDEDLGNNCGKYSYKCGELIDCDIPDNYDDAYEFLNEYFGFEFFKDENGEWGSE